MRDVTFEAFNELYCKCRIKREWETSYVYINDAVVSFINHEDGGVRVAFKCAAQFIVLQL